MASVIKLLLFAAVFVVAVALSGAGVSAENHHFVGGDRGWGPDLDVGSWLSGRVFRVGDKLWFKTSGTEDSIVELKSLEDLESCNLENPIRMYTDPLNHVDLEKEGARYFTSGNLDNCKNGHKLHVPVHPPSEFGPSDKPYYPPHEFGPPDDPRYSPPKEPEYGPPDHPYAPPHEPVRPPKEPEYGPPDHPYAPPHEPVRPPPEYEPPPKPSAATSVPGMSVVVFVAAALVCYMGF